MMIPMLVEISLGAATWPANSVGLARATSDTRDGGVEGDILGLMRVEY